MILLEKYNELKKTIENNNKDEEVSKEDELKELDMNGKYIFFIGKYSTFANKLEEAFPNSAVYNSTVQIDPNTDMVVVLTQCIDHSLYYSVKKQCKQKDVPMIHCDYSNIELIKQMMLTEIE